MISKYVNALQNNYHKVRFETAGVYFFYLGALGLYYSIAQGKGGIFWVVGSC
jgi:hypothetical protein